MTWTDRLAGKEWPKLLGLVVLAAFLAAIGWAIAGNYEPASIPVAATTEPTSTTENEPEPTTTVVTATVVAPAPTGAVALSFSQEGISFDDADESLEVQLANTGDIAGAWSASADHAAVTVTPTSGELGPAESLTLTLALDRSQIEQGDFSAVITVSWDGGTVELSAVTNVVDTGNPIIHNPKASPPSVEVDSGGGCSPTQTTISARVRDDSEMESVVVRWNDGSISRETRMNPTTEDNYAATIGPFSSTGAKTARIVAFDVHGNAGGASATVDVTACS